MGNVPNSNSKCIFYRVVGLSKQPTIPHMRSFLDFRVHSFISSSVGSWVVVVDFPVSSSVPRVATASSII